MWGGLRPLKKLVAPIKYIVGRLGAGCRSAGLPLPDGHLTGWPA
jgi:hypothetical protein